MTDNTERAREVTNISDYRRGQAFAAGKKARAAGKPRDANNRQPCTIYYDDWSDGWAEVDAALAAFASPPTTGGDVIDMVLHCPKCGLQHIDEADPEGVTSVEMSGRETRWDNPPHRSHLCHGCGCIWRPADVPTNGVREVSTVGKADNWQPRVAALATAQAAEGERTGKYGCLREHLDREIERRGSFESFMIRAGLLNEILDDLEAAPPTTGPVSRGADAKDWSCSARKQSLPEPADCGWPTCGCDPYASKVIDALEEGGIAAPALDQLDALADAWMAQASVERMANAIASVFSKWADEDIMSRFREKITALMHLAYVEGAASSALRALPAAQAGRVGEACIIALTQYRATPDQADTLGLLIRRGLTAGGRDESEAGKIIAGLAKLIGGAR